MISFNRGSEDLSLAYRKRQREEDEETESDEELYTYGDEALRERIDSNVLYALLAFCSRSRQHVDRLTEVMQSRTQEFTRKCARLLLIYV